MSLSGTLLKLAIRNFRSHLLYMFSAGLTIAVAYSGMTLFKLYAIETEKNISTVFEERFMMGDLVIFSGNARPKYPLGTEQRVNLTASEISRETAAKVLSILSREDLAPLASMQVLSFKGMITSGRAVAPFIGRGYELQSALAFRTQKWSWDAIAGIPLETANELNSISLGRRLAEGLGCRIDSQYDCELSGAGFVPRIRPFSCEKSSVKLSTTASSGRLEQKEVGITGIIDGVFQDLDKNIVSAPLPLAQELSGTSNISYFTVKLHPDQSFSVFQKNLTRSFKENGLQLNSASWKSAEEGDIYERAISTLDIFFVFVSILISVLTFFSLYFSFKKIATERLPEWTTLRSIGFNRLHLLILICFESLLLIIASLSVGIAMTGLSAAAINGLHLSYQVGGLSYEIPFFIGMDARCFANTGLIAGTCCLASALTASWLILRQPLAEGFSSATPT